MSERGSVRSFRSWLRTPAGVLVVVVAVLAFLYSLLIEGAVLFGAFVVLAVLVVP